MGIPMVLPSRITTLVTFNRHRICRRRRGLHGLIHRRRSRLESDSTRRSPISPGHSSKPRPILRRQRATVHPRPTPFTSIPSIPIPRFSIPSPQIQQKSASNVFSAKAYV